MKFFLLIMLMFVATFNVAAQDLAPAINNVEAKKIAEQKLESLFSKIRNDPKNLDHNFSYAQLATQLGKYDEALAAYERMLILDSNLPRVKLEMALVYMRINNAKEAEKLLLEVLKTNPPEQVKKNINQILSQVGTLRKHHSFNGSISVGWHGDSNANTAPSSEFQDTYGISAPLDTSSLGATDDQLFSAISLNHGYRFTGPQGHSWQSNFTYYRTKQSSISSLDLTMKSFRTGPVFIFPEINSKLTLAGQYTDTNLNHLDYQKAFRQELGWQYKLHPQLQTLFTFTHDFKTHQNTPSSSTFTDRNGESWEGKLGFTYVYSPKTVALITFTQHHERTKKNYYNYLSKTADIKFIHQFPYKLSGTAGINFVNTSYNAPDLTVNPDVTRSDNLRTYSLSLSRPINKYLSVTGGYTYKNSFSNIQNYRYENEQWSLTFTSQF